MKHLLTILLISTSLHMYCSSKNNNKLTISIQNFTKKNADQLNQLSPVSSGSLSPIISPDKLRDGGLYHHNLEKLAKELDEKAAIKNAEDEIENQRQAQIKKKLLLLSNVKFN